MSYQSRMRVVQCDAHMKAVDVRKAKRLLDDVDIFLESSFLEEMRGASERAIDVGMPEATIDIPPKRCWLTGNYVSDKTLAMLAPMIVGKLSGYFVGEDGSLHGGFVIEGGRLTTCDVAVTLTPKAAAQ
jgi:hypothetical protein